MDTAWPPDRPSSVDRLIDFLSKAQITCRRLFEAWTRAEEHYTRFYADHGFPDDFKYVEPPDSAEPLSDRQHAEAERARLRTPRFELSYQVLDDLTLAVRDWRRVLDEAREATPAVAAWMDDSRKPLGDRWTTKTISEIRALTGLVHRLQVGDCPLLGRGVPPQLQRLTSAIVDRMESLKSVTLASQVATPGRENSSAYEMREMPTAGHAVLEEIHRAVRSHTRDFKEAGRWLDDEYGERKVRRRRQLAEEGSEQRETSRLPRSAHAIPGPRDKSVDTRLWRLSAVLMDLVADPPDLTTFAVEDPVLWARRVLLVVAVVTDRNAGKYAGKLTQLAKLPWQPKGGIGRAGAASVELEEGRGPVVELGRKALALVVRRSPVTQSRAKKRARGSAAKSVKARGRRKEGDGASDVPNSARKPLKADQKLDGWTKQELIQQVDGISPSTFDRIRKAAEIPPPPRGKHSFRYGPRQLSAMIAAASNTKGKREWGNAAQAWRDLLIASPPPPPTS